MNNINIVLFKENFVKISSTILNEEVNQYFIEILKEKMQKKGYKFRYYY